MRNLLIYILAASSFILSCDKEAISHTQADHFVKYFTNYPVFTAADVVTTTGGYAVLGTATYADGGSWICLLRTDRFGNSIDTARLYGLPYSDQPTNVAWCLKALGDGGFAILGSGQNLTTGYRSVYFIRTNNAGDTLWTRTISNNGDLEARCFEISDQESFYMTGYFQRSANDKEIWWFGLDSQGRDIRNQRIFGFSANDEGYNLKILPDGRLLITGYITKSAGVRRAFVIKTDENTIFEALFEIPSDANERGDCILPLNADNCLLLGTSANAAGSQMTLKSVDLAATRPEDVVVWQKNYSSSAAEVSKSLLMDDQSIYILGTTTISSSSTSITLTAADHSGNQTGRHEFGIGSRLSAAAFKRTADNGFIITGTNVHPEVNNTSLALIKISRDSGL